MILLNGFKYMTRTCIAAVLLILFGSASHQGFYAGHVCADIKLAFATRIIHVTNFACASTSMTSKQHAAQQDFDIIYNAYCKHSNKHHESHTIPWASEGHMQKLRRGDRRMRNPRPIEEREKQGTKDRAFRPAHVVNPSDAPHAPHVAIGVATVDAILHAFTFARLHATNTM